MTAQPIPLPPVIRKDPCPQLLRRVPESVAHAEGLVTMRQIALHYGTSLANVRLYLRRPGSPACAGETEKPNGTRREKLFSLTGFEDFVYAQGDSFGTRRRSRPPRRVGTSTPGQGRVYAWRDPARTR